MKFFIKNTLKIAAVMAVSVAVMVVLIAVLYLGTIYFSVRKDFNRIVSVDILPVPTKVYSSDGKVIAKLGLQNRIPVKLSNISPNMKYAILASEDARFYDHGAIDLIGITRALLKDIAHKKILQGGSTITQQLVKNIYLTPSRTLTRKLKEVILAYRLEMQLSKDQILELYLNTVYFGAGAWGIEAAARRYFDTHASDLTIAQSSLLAGLVKAPTSYNPYNHPQLAKKRMMYVLKRMYDNHFISLKQYRIAMNTKIVLKKHPPNFFGLIVAPYFADYVKNWLVDKFGEDVVYKSGLTVYTTLDTQLQRYAFISVKTGILKLKKKYDGLQGALISMDPKTGYVKSMVGGFSYEDSQFNRALQAKRQPGSSFKPFIYLSAIQQGYMPTDTVKDEPVVFRFSGQEWRPQNYEGTFHGTVTLMYALAHSVNIATINLLNNIGVKSVIKLARKLGISEPIPPDLSIALGSLSLRLIELVRAYATFDNYGLLPKPIFVTRVVNRDGEVIYEDKPKLKRVFDTVDGFILTGMLKNVVNYGTGRKAKVIGRPLAGKTGTTNDYKDAWFVGYSPSLVCGVWVGYDSNKTIFKGATGARAALPIWIMYMKNALKGKTIETFPIPQGITPEVINSLRPPERIPSYKSKAKPTIQDVYEKYFQ
jgi:penicillin-binding protein 1A